MPQRKIIHVDDDEAILRAAARFLEARGITVVPTSSPFVAPIVKAERPDLIVMDVDMPLLPGDRIVAIMRSHDFSAIPVVFFSGKPESRLATICASVPNSSYVMKGAGLEALHDRILLLLGP